MKKIALSLYQFSVTKGIFIAFSLIAFAFLAGCNSSSEIDTSKTLTVDQAKNSQAVTVEIFSDFNCIHCKHLEPTIQKLENNLPEVEFTSYFIALFGNSSFAASMATECVREENEAEVQKFILSVFNAKTKSTGVLKSLATKAGVSEEKYNACMKGSQSRAIVSGYQKESVNRGIKGTPTIYINGEKYEGSREYEVLKAFIVSKKK